VLLTWHAVKGGPASPAQVPARQLLLAQLTGADGPAPLRIFLETLHCLTVTGTHDGGNAGGQGGQWQRPLLQKTMPAVVSRLVEAVAGRSGAPAQHGALRAATALAAQIAHWNAKAPAGEAALSEALLPLRRPAEARALGGCSAVQGQALQLLLWIAAPGELAAVAAPAIAPRTAPPRAGGLRGGSGLPPAVGRQVARELLSRARIGRFLCTTPATM